MAARAIEAPFRVVIKKPPAARFGTPQIELVPTKTLKRSPRNARTHSKKQIDQIVSSIRRFGWTSPILIDEDGHIIAGHGRLEAAIRIGLKVVPVISVSRLSDTERRALALADNKIAANAGWDRAALAAELGELALLLPECNLDIEITGFEAAEIDALLGDLVDPDQDPVDQDPVPEKEAISIAGDLWKLGDHRLLCGDCLVPGNLHKLMGSKLARLVIADPPFNVRIKDVQGRGRRKHREFPQASGEMSSDQFTEFLRKSMELAAQYSVDGSIAFWFIDWRHISEMQTAGKAVYSELKNFIVWAKDNAGQGTFYRSQHELIFAFKNGDAPHTNNFELGQHGRSRSNVWRYPGVNTFRTGRLDDLSVHPTVKPVALVADAMRDCSRRGEIVLDPFVGSGTTILAAERVGRRGYGLEIDPVYVDVAIRRWQAYTKRDAVLKATGQTFDEVSRERTSSKQSRRIR